MKLCTECRHCRIDPDRWERNVTEFAKCAKYTVDSPVDGKPVMRYCSAQRSLIGDCGEDGKGWMALIGADAQDSYDDEARQDACWRQEFERRERATNGKA